MDKTECAVFSEFFMVTFCDTCIGAICDFCYWYDFNGDEEGAYTGDGYCRLHQEDRDPDDECGDFYCCRVASSEGFSRPRKTGKSG